MVKADKADRTREQNTVGDLSGEQVNAALERQLQRSKKSLQSSSDSASSSARLDKAMEEIEAGTDASKAEQQESLRTLKDLKSRVPLMSQSESTSAMNRLLDGGKGGSDTQAEKGNGKGNSKASAKSAEKTKARKPRKSKASAIEANPDSKVVAKTGTESSESKSDSKTNSKANGQTPSSGKKAGGGKHSPDEEFEDGTVLYTALSLSKISFADLGK